MKNSNHTSLADPEKFDVIVVMGSAVWPGGVPSPALKRRLDHGVFLWQQEIAENLLLTGGTGRFPPAEAQVMRQLALAAGVPPENIFTEEAATTTFRNVQNCAEIMAQQEWRSVLVVSDFWHLRRSVWLFRCMDIVAIGNGTRSGSTGLLCLFFYHIREIAAIGVYFLRMFKSNPRGALSCLKKIRGVL